jgi:uncharacterized membrane protein YqjE
MMLLSAATSLNLLAALIMTAFFPVFSLARKATVARFAAAALLGQLWQLGSTRGTFREDHGALQLSRSWPISMASHLGAL